MDFNLAAIPSPCFVLEEAKLTRNLLRFQRLQQAAPVKVLMALKAFTLFHAFPMIRAVLAGASASSPWEARLAAEAFGGELHVYAPAYRESDLAGLLALSTHLTFNSLSQWQRFQTQTTVTKTSIGLRINPLYSPVETALYNPCQPDSRLGVLPTQLTELPPGIEGFLSHNLCESNHQALEKTLFQIEHHFGHLLPQLKWLNLGGGHLITHAEYDLDSAITALNAFHGRHPHLELIMEPGAAIVWQTGFLLSTVLDLIPVGHLTHMMLDVSFTAHMPDCLEMPYQPTIVGARPAQEGEQGYRLGGASCLAGDFLGDYVFERSPEVGTHLQFEDMMHYTMVKTSTFNGVGLPAMGMLDKTGNFTLWREFNYADYRARVG